MLKLGANQEILFPSMAHCFQEILHCHAGKILLGKCSMIVSCSRSCYEILKKPSFCNNVFKDGQTGKDLHKCIDSWLNELCSIFMCVLFKIHCIIISIEVIVTILFQFSLLLILQVLWIEIS